MASSTKKEEVTIESRLDDLLAMLRQSIEDNKSRITVVEKLLSKATYEQREQLVFTQALVYDSFFFFA